MPGVTHEVRNSLIDSTRLFRLESDGFSWQAGSRQEERRFTDIGAVHLIGYPGYGGRHLQCTLTDRAGKRLIIRSHHYVSLGRFEDRSESYGQFMRALIARLGSEGRDMKYYQGSSVMRAIWSVLFGTSVVVLVGYMFAVIGGHGLSLGAVIPMATIALLLPVSWAMMRQPPAGRFDPKAPPAGLLGGG